MSECLYGFCLLKTGAPCHSKFGTSWNTLTRYDFTDDLTNRQRLPGPLPSSNPSTARGLMAPQGFFPGGPRFLVSYKLKYLFSGCSWGKKCPSLRYIKPMEYMMGHAAAAGFLEAETNFRAARRYRRPVVLTKGPFQAKKKTKIQAHSESMGDVGWVSHQTGTSMGCFRAEDHERITKGAENLGAFFDGGPGTGDREDH